MNTAGKNFRTGLLMLALGFALTGTAQAGSLRMQLSDSGAYGERALLNGDYAEAARRLEYALELAGEARSLRAPILNDLCIAYTLLGQTERALARCDAAVAAGRDRGRALNNRAVARIAAGDVDGAAADLRAALTAPGAPAAARVNLRLVTQPIAPQLAEDEARVGDGASGPMPPAG